MKKLQIIVILLILSSGLSALYQANLKNNFPSTYSCDCETEYEKSILSVNDLGKKIIIKEKLTESKGLSLLKSLNEIGYSIYKIEDVELASTTLIEEKASYILDQIMHSTMLNGKEILGLGPSMFLDSGDNSVAILDTGINIYHDTFDEKQLLNWKDFIGKSADLDSDLYIEPKDVNGHGTAVTSIIVGQKTRNSSYNFDLNIDYNTLKFISQVELKNNQTIYINAELDSDKKIQFGLYDLDKEQIFYISDEVYGQYFTWNYTYYTEGVEIDRYMVFIANPNELGSVHAIGNISYPLLYEYSGVCPGAKFVAIKVLDDEGIGYLSSFLSGIDYLLQVKEEFNITVVNLSLGFDERIFEVDEAITEVVNNGIVVVASAGNGGTVEDVKSPGASSEAITVGAINRDGHVAYYSSHGCLCPLRDIKPDVLAFGGSSSTRYLRIKVASSSNHTFEGVEGTSFATAYISGIALHFTSLHSWNYSWEEVKEIKFRILMSTYETIFGEDFNGDSDFVPQEPSLDYYKKDRIEGWGAYYHSNISQVNLTSKINFSLSRTKKPLQLFVLNTKENTEYAIEVESNSNVIINIVNSMDNYGNPIQLIESEPKRNVTYAIKGNNKPTYLIIKSFYSDSNISLNIQLNSKPILNITSVLPERITNIRDVILTFDYFNGIPNVIFDGNNAKNNKISDGCYFFKNLKDGKHQIYISVTNQVTGEKVDFSYEWYVDTQAPLVYWNGPENNSILFEKTFTIAFQVSDIHLVDYVKFTLDNSNVESLLLETSPANITFSFEKSFYLENFANESIITFKLFTYDTVGNEITNSLFFTINYFNDSYTNQPISSNSSNTQESSFPIIGIFVGLGVLSSFYMITSVKDCNKIKRGK